MTYTLVTRKYDVVALDDVTGHRIGNFDFTAGSSRGTIRGRVVSRTYSEWIREVEVSSRGDTNLGGPPVEYEQPFPEKALQDALERLRYSF